MIAIRTRVKSLSLFMLRGHFAINEMFFPPPNTVAVLTHKPNRRSNLHALLEYGWIVYLYCLVPALPENWQLRCFFDRDTD